MNLLGFIAPKTYISDVKQNSLKLLSSKNNQPKIQNETCNYIIFLDKIQLFSLKKNIARFAEKFAKAISAVSGEANVIGGQHVL